MTTKEAKDAIAKHGSLRAAAAALHIRRSTLSSIAKGQTDTREGAKSAAKTAGKPAGKTLAEFRQAYDKATIVPAKIKAALKTIGAAGWQYEVDFARIAGASLADIGMFRDQFAAYIVALKDRRAWAGSARLASQMREMI